MFPMLAAIFSCATSDVSQIIDPRGQVRARLPAMAEGSIVATIRRETKLTFYTRAGWLVPWITLAAAVIAWGSVLIPRRNVEPGERPDGSESEV